jgi:hypothetical protein
MRFFASAAISYASTTVSAVVGLRFLLIVKVAIIRGRWDIPPLSRLARSNESKYRRRKENPKLKEESGSSHRFRKGPFGNAFSLGAQPLASRANVRELVPKNQILIDRPPTPAAIGLLANRQPSFASG